MNKISEISGWALDAICHLDQVHQHLGLAGHFLRASPERRQVISAFLSRQTSLDLAPEAARMLVTAGSRDILLAAFQSVPEGLRGALGRTGPQPEARGYYGTLHRLLGDPRQADAARTIRQVKTLSENRLHAIMRLPRHLRRPSIADQVPDLKTARDLASAFDLIQSNSGCDPATLAAALKTASRTGSVQNWAAGWMERLAFPENPIPDSEVYRAVKNGRELRRIAVRYRNCSRTLLVALVEGHSSLAELTCASGNVLVHLRRRPNDHVIDSINIARNRPIDPTLNREALRFLRSQGIAEPSFRRRTFRFAPLQRLAALGDDWRWT